MSSRVNATKMKLSRVVHCQSVSLVLSSGELCRLLKMTRGRCLLKKLKRCDGGARASFRFPKEETAKEDWKWRIRWPCETPLSDHARLCSNHFHADDVVTEFRSGKPRYCLGPEAVPFQHVRILQNSNMTQHKFPYLPQRN